MDPLPQLTTDGRTSISFTVAGMFRTLPVESIEHSPEHGFVAIITGNIRERRVARAGITEVWVKPYNAKKNRLVWKDGKAVIQE